MKKQEKSTKSIRMTPKAYKMLTVLAAMTEKHMGDILEELLLPVYQDLIKDLIQNHKS